MSVTIINEYSYIVMEKGIKNEKSSIKFKDSHNNYPILIQVIKDMNDPISVFNKKNFSIHSLDTNEAL